MSREKKNRRVILMQEDLKDFEAMSVIERNALIKALLEVERMQVELLRELNQ